MDWVEAAAIGQIVGETRAEQERNQLIVAHVTQGYDLSTATALTDQYLAQQRQRPESSDPITNFIQMIFALALLIGVLFGVGTVIVAILIALGIIQP